MQKNNFKEQRRQLVQAMEKHGAITSSAVKNAFLKVKREIFFPENILQYAYADSAFPIGFGQTISQPSTIAPMLEMLDMQKGSKVLEVGSGSGYVLALLAELAGSKGKVFAVELVHELHQKASKTILQLGYENIFMRCGDGTLGWKEEAPFGRILISAACQSVPAPLIEQLKEHGKLVAPIGGRYTQELVMIEKEAEKVLERQKRGYYVFVPLKGKYGSI